MQMTVDAKMASCVLAMASELGRSPSNSVLPLMVGYTRKWWISNGNRRRTRDESPTHQPATAAVESATVLQSTAPIATLPSARDYVGGGVLPCGRGGARQSGPASPSDCPR